MKTDKIEHGEVINFEQARALITLRKIEAAMSRWITSTVELADLAYEARLEECWRVDEDFAAARAAGSMDPADQRNISRQWLGWKFNRAGRVVEYLADYGELRSIIGADPTLPALAEPERAARPLGKLLRPKYIGKEVPNVEERNEAIRRVWRDAVSLTESGTPAEAVKAIGKALKRTDYKPLKRLLTKSEAQKSLERQSAVTKARKTMTEAGYVLLRLGAIDVFDEVLAEMTEARRR